MAFLYFEKVGIIQFILMEKKIISIKRHIQFDRITANELCKQAGLGKQY
jgi:hypothetical protein